MAAAHSRTISPILADISQDIAGVIPLDLILLWSTSDRSAKKHQQLLEPHEKSGVVVSSDASGLSKLSAEKTLLEVMQLVSQPKESIYGYGKAVGGEAIGIWVADNTQMFYDQSIDPKEVLNAMVVAQSEIKENCLVQVGMGIHYGKFIEIGGGLYGKDATTVEELAENYTAAGEIALTGTMKQKLGKGISKFITPHQTFPKAFSLSSYQHDGDMKKHTASDYPYPFHPDFYQVLKNISSLSSVEVEKKYNTFLQHSLVIFLKIHHQSRRLLLEKLTDYIVANAYVQQALREYKDVQLVKSNGDLGIFIAHDRETAIDFAKTLFEKLHDNNFDLNIALTQGEVLLFPLHNGFEIAGGPVNVASKLTEDSGQQNRVLIEGSVGMPETNAQEFSFTVSKVVIKGQYLI